MSDLRNQINISIADFTKRGLREASMALLTTLGYESQRVLPFDTLGEFYEALPEAQIQLAKVKDVRIKTFHGLFQLTADEVRTYGQNQMFSAGQYKNSIINSYLFIALELEPPAKNKPYTRSQLAELTKTINKTIGLPVFLIIKHGQYLSLSVTRRRINKRDNEKDVLEKITIIKDIDCQNTNAAHLRILDELQLGKLLQGRIITRFVELEEAWAKVLDIDKLNERFYKELSAWFYWAASHEGVSFPDEKKTEVGQQRQRSLIRLITRLIFTWFLKEKNLVPNQLFETRQLEQILKNFAPLETKDSTYYQSVLQNLFFATLNTETGLDETGQPNRQFKDDSKTRNNAAYMVHNLYRYKSSFKNAQTALELFSSVPFLNGGLFECLDRPADSETGEKEQRIDGFSDDTKKRAKIPNELFFSPERVEDLSTELGSKYKKAKVRGLLEILSSYKFTITENTPVEEEVALDPELLGKVFENLLAAYNEETRETARKQTGSFYTPRDIVDFMVDESLIAYLHHALTGGQPVVSGVQVGEQAPMLIPENDPNILITPNAPTDEPDPLERHLRTLFSYQEEFKPELFTANQISKLIKAIENVKILDPACGSGAFPMGVLQKMVHVLGRLDPNNQLWLEAQRAKLQTEIESDPEIKTIQKDLKTIEALQVQSIRNQAEREAVKRIQERIANLEESFNETIADPNYARKLYLIEDCIYGVDIQPIAIQIAKLRCFIALVVEQKQNDTAPNRGIRPLPNLETKFVAANSLLDLAKDRSMAEFDPDVMRLKKELENVRHKHFMARRFKDKKALRREDKNIRAELKKILLKYGWNPADATGMAAFDPYDQNVFSEFFSPEWMYSFPTFDVVIGNPPYVRHEKIKDQKINLQKAYGTFYNGTADLYVYFFKRSLDILSPHGVLSFICSNKYFRSGYGLNLRKHLLEKNRMRQIIDFGDADVFTAIAYPSIILIQNSKPSPQDAMRVLAWNQKDNLEDFQEIYKTQSFTMPQSSLSHEAWRIEKDNVLKLLETIKSAGMPLGEYVGGRFYRGVLTGLNEAFVVDKDTKEALIQQHPSSAEVLKPFLRGRDVKRWKIENPELWLIFTRRGIDINKYPAIKNHLEQFRTQLEPGEDGGRKAGSYKWFEIQDNIAYWKEFEQPKIMYQEIATYQAFAWDENEFYCNNKAFIIPNASKTLLALLNSKVMLFILDNTVQKMQGDAYAMQTIYLEQIPIAQASSEVSELITQLVNHILFASTQPTLGAVVAYFEQMIDALVYELYLPEILHSAGRQPFVVIGADPPPTSSTLEGLQGYYRRTYDPNHEIRKLLYYLDSIDEIRIIEGKSRL